MYRIKRSLENTPYLPVPRCNTSRAYDGFKRGHLQKSGVPLDRKESKMALEANCISAAYDYGLRKWRLLPACIENVTRCHSCTDMCLLPPCVQRRRSSCQPPISWSPPRSTPSTSPSARLRYRLPLSASRDGVSGVRGFRSCHRRGKPYVFRTGMCYAFFVALVGEVALNIDCCRAAGNTQTRLRS